MGEWLLPGWIWGISKVQIHVNCEIPLTHQWGVRSPILGTHPAGSPMFSHFVDDCSTAENESTKSFRGWCVQRTANLAWEHENISKCLQWTKKTDDLNRNNNVSWPTCRYDWDDFTKKNREIHDLRWPKNGTPTGTSFHQDNEDPPVQRRRFFGDG